MTTDALSPTIRMIVRYVALGLTDEDICVSFPDFSPAQIAKMRTGSTFKRALAEMQEKIDEEIVAKTGEDAVRTFLRSKGLVSARVLADLAENVDGGTPHAVRVKAADSILAKAGYGDAQQVNSVPVLMLSVDKLKAIMNKPDVLRDVPDCVDGHSQELPFLPLAE
jgi:hypothetical protein